MNQHEADHTTLRRRMTIQLGLMVVCSLLIGVGAIVGIESLHVEHGVSVRGYRQLRQVYEVGFQVAIAKDALLADQADPARALSAMEAALLKLDPDYYQGSGELPAYWLDESKRKECRQPISETIDLLKSPDSGSGDALLREQSLVNDALGQFAMLSAQIRTTIVGREEQANQERQLTLLLVVGLSAAVVIVAVTIGARQYRGVVEPLDRLSESVRRFASGEFSERIGVEKDREFAALASDFNHMASQLETLYRDLEDKVEIKSRELVRSERLASVGYLAAGVAHEINNPLSIITGYGERSLRLLDRELDESAVVKTRNGIRIICEEAFRCKNITDRLLSLAKPGTDDRRAVSLSSIAEEVIGNVGGLPEYANRRIILESDCHEELSVFAKDGEIKQVIMNLLLNALEAVSPTNGRVGVSIMRTDNEIELAITDNGQGMSPQTLERIFEPFFTEKRGERRGMGLGLSITHAIVAAHGGRLRAESAGPGLGSRFVVRLPVLLEGAQHADC
jgi:two-component system, NtrC family, sensor kinase